MAALAGALPIERAFAKDTTVGFIYVGPRDDFGYNQAHAEGAAALKKMAGVKVVEEERIPETVQVAKTMESMINLDGAGLLFPTSFGYFDPYILKEAVKYPEGAASSMPAVCGPTRTRRTSAAISATSSKAQYINGIVAGYASKSGKLGFVAAKPIPQVLQNINAFTLGARLVNPNATTQLIFTGDWSLPVKEAEATNSMVDQGIDVITMHVDSPKVVVQTAAQRGAMVCGYHTSQAKLAPEAYLTGAEWNWTDLYPKFVTMWMKGEHDPELLSRRLQGRPDQAIALRPEGLRRGAQARRRHQGEADRRRLRDLQGPAQGQHRQDRRRRGQRTDPDQRDRRAARIDALPGRGRDGKPAGLTGSGDGRGGRGGFAGGRRHRQGRPPAAARRRDGIGRAAEAVVIPLGALVVSLVLFGVFVAFAGVNPLDVYDYMVVGSVGSWFSIQNTLTRAAPLDPHRALHRAAGADRADDHRRRRRVRHRRAGRDRGRPAARRARRSPLVVQLVMALAGMAGGAAWIAMAGALRHWRGVNETISTLLLTYIGIAVLNHMVEGVMRDPASLNKPSSHALPDADMIGNIPGTEVHWGLVFGIVFCVVAYVLMFHTTFGFAARMVGGNPRAARLAGLPVGRIILIVTGAGRRRRGPCRHDRGRRRAGPRQRHARGGLWLYRHSRRLHRAAESAGGHSGRVPVRRHRRERRAAAAPARPARRLGAGAAGHHLRRDPGERDPVRAVPHLPAEGGTRWPMPASAGGACRWRWRRARCAPARRSCSSASASCSPRNRAASISASKARW